MGGSIYTILKWGIVYAVVLHFRPLKFLARFVENITMGNRAGAEVERHSSGVSGDSAFHHSCRRVLPA